MIFTLPLAIGVTIALLVLSSFVQLLYLESLRLRTRDRASLTFFKETLEDRIGYDLGRLQVDTFVDEVDIGKVKVGQKATFTVDSFPSREFAGKVVAIYPKAVIQENVVNYDVVVEITDPYDGLLRPEMTASVTIQLDARENVLAVPVKAVKRERGKSVVYVRSSSGNAQPREVKVGWKDSQWVEIVSGLDEGQTVFLEAPTSGKAAAQ